MESLAAKLPPPERLEGLRVFPGDPLCTIEEFSPGDGVYVDDKGVVRAAVAGVVRLDRAARRISVEPLSAKPRMPRRGRHVYGVVLGVPREDLALVKIFADERMVPYNGFFNGVVHISQASDKMIKSIYDAIKPGDIVKALVLSPTPPYMLSLKRPQEGVVLAFCSNCGAPLYKPQGRSDVLICKRCGNTERRKIAPNYLLVEKRREPHS